MTTPRTAPDSLDAAAQAQQVVIGQFAQVATLIRAIAKIEALAQQEGIADGLKEILHQESAAAYERLKTIREWTDGEISRVLATATAPTDSPMGEAPADVDFGSLIPAEWELLDLSTRLRLQSGSASVEQVADAKEKVRAFRRKLATFGKPYAELTEKERLRLRLTKDPKQ